MVILAIQIGHNASTTLIKDGVILLHIEEERLSKIKRDGNPMTTLKYISHYTEEVDHLVIGSSSDQVPVIPWNGGSYYKEFLIKSGVYVKEEHINKKTHHMFHALNSFYNSNFEEGITVVIDGAGTELGINIDNEIVKAFEAESIIYTSYKDEPKLLYSNLITNEDVSDTRDYYSIDSKPTIVKMYEGITEHIGMPGIEAGKTMGLSAYGKSIPEIDLLSFDNRGNQEFYSPVYPRTSTFTPPTDNELHPADLAYEVQKASEEVAHKFIQRAIAIAKKNNITTKNICISGGYGLNVVNNYKLLEAFPEYTFWFEPTCNDSGNSISMAKDKYLEVTEDKEEAIKSIRGMSDYFTGIHPALFVVSPIDGLKETPTTPKEVAELLVNGEIVAIFQGRSEAGPRALGNRSFMFSPTIANAREQLNVVKQREMYRPFAVSILKEEANKWYTATKEIDSPYMMLSYPVKTEQAAFIPGALHVDNTTRLQTVEKSDNKFRKVIEEFNALTGVPMIINTSLNLSGEPLVEDIMTAKALLKKAKFNYVYLADLDILVSKEKEETVITESELVTEEGK